MRPFPTNFNTQPEKNFLTHFLLRDPNGKSLLVLNMRFKFFLVFNLLAMWLTMSFTWPYLTDLCFRWRVGMAWSSGPCLYISISRIYRIAVRHICVAKFVNYKSDYLLDTKEYIYIYTCMGVFTHRKRWYTNDNWASRLRVFEPIYFEWPTQPKSAHTIKQRPRAEPGQPEHSNTPGKQKKGSCFNPLGWWNHRTGLYIWWKNQSRKFHKHLDPMPVRCGQHCFDWPPSMF